MAGLRGLLIPGGLALAAAAACSAASGPLPPDPPIERLRVEVLAQHPHDPGAFTQGLLWAGGLLYESTGLYGESSLRRVDPATGTVLEAVPLPLELFGEGLALVGERLIQLTWQSGVALVYDRGTLAALDPLSYSGEGWGLAWDGERLLMTDGSARVTFRDPVDFRPLGGIDVTLAGKPLGALNELEVADGVLWANVWGEERIVRIDPASGRVTAIVDASRLLSVEERRRADVLNGIAYDPVSGSFWITGKLWPRTFRVRFVPVLVPGGGAPG